jgi:hypothetical protein
MYIKTTLLPSYTPVTKYGVCDGNVTLPWFDSTVSYLPSGEQQVSDLYTHTQGNNNVQIS